MRKIDASSAVNAGINEETVIDPNTATQIQVSRVVIRPNTSLLTIAGGWFAAAYSCTNDVPNCRLSTVTSKSTVPTSNPDASPPAPAGPGPAVAAPAPSITAPTDIPDHEKVSTRYLLAWMFGKKKRTGEVASEELEN